MSDRKVYDTSEIRVVAQEFVRGAQSSQDLLSRMQTLVTNLAGSFQGVAARRFFDEFQQHAVQLKNTVTLYENIGKELNDLASRIENFDQTLLSSS